MAKHLNIVLTGTILHYYLHWDFLYKRLSQYQIHSSMESAQSCLSRLILFYPQWLLAGSEFLFNLSPINPPRVLNHTAVNPEPALMSWWEMVWVGWSSESSIATGRLYWRQCRLVNTFQIDTSDFIQSAGDLSVELTPAYHVFIVCSSSPKLSVHAGKDKHE